MQVRCLSALTCASTITLVNLEVRAATPEMPTTSAAQDALLYTPPVTPPEPLPRPEPPWYQKFELGMFADAYASFNANQPTPQDGANATVRAFDTSNGFALSWIGLDARYPAQPFGATLNLRLGPSAQRWAGACLSARCDADHGLANVSQAFLTFRPGGEQARFSLDFGKFATLFGIEVSDSQANINYTRGLLFWLAEPAFHTGFRAFVDLGFGFELRGMLVNGQNNTTDNNLGKSLGVQGSYRLKRGAEDYFSASLGYFGGPERDDTLPVTCEPPNAFEPSSPSGCTLRAGVSEPSSGLLDRKSTNWSSLRHYLNAMAQYVATPELSFALNADLGFERLRASVVENLFRTTHWYGIALFSRYRRGIFAAGIRGEYMRDADGSTLGIQAQDLDLLSGTLTLDLLPTAHALLRLDNRIDWANYKIFRSGIRDTSGVSVTSTLGVVVSTQ